MAAATLLGSMEGSAVGPNLAGAAGGASVPGSSGAAAGASGPAGFLDAFLQAWAAGGQAAAPRTASAYVSASEDAAADAKHTGAAGAAEARDAASPRDSSPARAAAPQGSTGTETQLRTSARLWRSSRPAIQRGNDQASGRSGGSPAGAGGSGAAAPGGAAQPEALLSEAAAAAAAPAPPRPVPEAPPADDEDKAQCRSEPAADGRSGGAPLGAEEPSGPSCETESGSAGPLQMAAGNGRRPGVSAPKGQEAAATGREGAEEAPTARDASAQTERPDGGGLTAGLRPEFSEDEGETAAGGPFDRVASALPGAVAANDAAVPAANFSTAARAAPERGVAAGQAGKKDTLVTGVKNDADATEPLGIAGAQTTPVMFAQASYLSSSAVHAAAAVGSLTGWTGSGRADAANSPQGGSGQTAASSAVQQAVETVMRIADAQTRHVQGAVSSVNLSFNFGSENLGVRLEWRDGVVQAQFRTASPELRAAVASEWQSMMAASPAKAQQFSSPLFSQADSSSGGAASSAGEGGDPQGGGQPAWLGPLGPRSGATSAGLPPSEQESAGEDAPAHLTAQILDAVA